MELASEIFGDPSAGPRPLLVAHGLFGSKRNWTSLARRFAETRGVATVDMRNHGDSPWAGEMDYAALGADLLQTAARLFDRAPILLGHSMGGKAAMAAALSRPDAVAGLIVADIAPTPYLDHPHEAYLGAMRDLALAGVTRRGALDPLLAPTVPEPELRAFILQNIVFDEGPEGRRARWRLNLDALAETVETLTGWPEGLASSSGARYAGPTFFFHGGASAYVGAAATPEIRALFPEAEIDVMPGAGHWLHAERPDAFFERVAAWLAEKG